MWQMEEGKKWEHSVWCNVINKMLHIISIMEIFVAFHACIKMNLHKQSFFFRTIPINFFLIKATCKKYIDKYHKDPPPLHDP